MNRSHLKSFALVLAVFGLVGLQVRAATVTATLDPAQISLGDSAQLTVTVTGSQEQPAVPNVDGLDITAVGQSTQIEIINGSMTANASNTYQVTPQREGTFVIPAIQAAGASSQPVTLTVGKGSAMAPSAQQALPPPSAGPVVLPPQAPPQGPVDNSSGGQGRYGWIQVVLPKKEVYEGELVPVEIRAYIPDNVQASVGDLPQFTSDGLTLNSLGTKPDQSTQVVSGQPFVVLTWHSALTGVKTGDYPFTLQMPISIVVPQQAPQTEDPDDLLNNFFRNAMSAMGTKKDVTIQNVAQTIKVLPLPLANRPVGFSGAVGQFDVEASASPTNVNVGDPITLRLKITGTGNFDRVSTDMLENNPQWKTYSPKSHFDSMDSIGYQGAKTFEQPIIPNDASASSVPSISFSYFDPETRQYVTRTTSPVAVTVSGSSANPVSSTGVASATPVVQPQPSVSPVPATPTDDLRANKIESGSFASTLRPIYLNPWFLAGQGLPLLALLGGWALLRRREQLSHPQRVRALAVQQAIRQQVEAMDQAMRNQQPDAFFVHARSALQQHLGYRWNMRPETITLADVETRLGSSGEIIRPIFEMADQASYSTLHFEEADLRQWRQLVMDELAEKN